jgi:D-alanyl-D-alanine carboxypeptidase
LLDGGTLQASLEARITEPLGLTQTRFAYGDTPPPDGLAAGWFPPFGYVGDPASETEAMASTSMAAGGLTSTASELATFLGALFDGGLMSAASLEAMQPATGDDYGFGLLDGDQALGLTGVGEWVGNGGVSPLGFRSFTAIEPVSGDIVVGLTNDFERPPEEVFIDLLPTWVE